MAKNDPQALGLAQAIAANGSAGAAAFKQAQSEQASQKNSAVSSAAGRAGLIGAPTDFLKQQAAQISAPYDQASAAAGKASSALGAYTGAMGGAHGNYLSELAAAKPIVQGDLDRGASGANLSQLLQVLNFKNSQEDREYTKAQHLRTQTAQDKELADAASQREALTKIISHPDKNLGAFTQNIIASATSLPEALAYLNSDAGQKDLKKKGISSDTEMRSLLAQYFDPTTYQSLPAAQTQAAPQAQAQAGGGYGGLSQEIGNRGALPVARDLAPAVVGDYYKSIGEEFTKPGAALKALKKFLVK